MTPDPLKIHFVVDMTAEAYELSPHMGVSYLSARLKERLPGTVVTVSCLGEDVVVLAEGAKPDVVGFSCTSRHFVEFAALAAEVKARCRVPVIFGGVHVSIAPSELPAAADAGVIGEGEETLPELLSGLGNGGFSNLGEIKGLVFRRDGKLVTTPPRPPVEDLDSLPPRDLTLRKLRWGRESRAVMVTSRGCPFKCRFCASSLFWNRARLHSAARVLREMKEITARFGTREILIYDDFFTIDKRRVQEIAGLKRADPALREIRLECLSRVDNFDAAMAALLKEMGVYRVSFGIESGSQRTLDYLKNKAVSLDQISRAVAEAKRGGLEAVGSFIIGSPYETEAEIRETLAFIKKLGLKSVQISVATPFPGTRLWEDGVAEGKITGGAWSDDYYALFVIWPDTDVRALLRDKKLLTPLPREVFLGLAEEAAALQKRINYTPAELLQERLRGLLLCCGLGFLLRWRRRLLGRAA